MPEVIRIRLTPVPKPRMTQSDRWKQRPCVVQYWEYKDRLKQSIDSYEWPEAYHVVFVMPMPKSWPKKKKLVECGRPCQSKPDKDNLEKGLLDALFQDDAVIWDGRSTKIWGHYGEIIIIPIAPFDGRNLIKRLYGSVDREAA